MHRTPRRKDEGAWADLGFGAINRHTESALQDVEIFLAVPVQMGWRSLARLNSPLPKCGFD
jgi:hypothetical protein